MSTASDGDWRARLSGVTRAAGLPDGALGPLELLVELLATDPQAPTTLRDRPTIVDRHIADSLCALELLAGREVTRLADIGSGAGLPGLPLAVARPACKVFLVESSRRKCAFLQRAVATTGLANVVVVNRRVEEWSEGVRGMDVVTARALAPPGVVLEYAAPLLRSGGVCMDWRAGDGGDATAVARLLGLELIERHAVKPFEQASELRIDLYVKVRDTPDRFPRRAGIARKRPLAP